MLKPYALRLLTATATAACVCVSERRTVLCGALYTACVERYFGTVHPHIKNRIPIAKHN